MRLKRIFLTCLLLLVAAALALPWWIGRDTEARYRALVASTSGTAAPFRLQLEGFDRGWLTSRARISVHGTTARAQSLMDALGTADASRGLMLTDRVSHGLLPIRRAGRGLGWRPALAAGEASLRPAASPDAAPLGVVAYRIGLDGGLALALDAPGAGTPPASSDRRFGWRDLDIEARLPAGPGPVTLDLSAARFGVPQPLGPLVLRNLAGRLEAFLPASGPPAGTMELSASRADIGAADGSGPVGGARDMALRADLENHDQQVRLAIEGRLAHLGSPRETYGPGEFRLTLNGLDARSLNRLLDSTARLRARGPGGRAGAMALAGALLAEAPALLAHGPVLELQRLELAGRDGPLQARGRLSLASAQPVVLRNPYLLQRAVTGRFDINVPGSAARHAALIHLRRNGMLEVQSPEGWLAEQVSLGRLTRHDDGYQASVRLSQGRVSLNGRPWLELSR